MRQFWEVWDIFHFLEVPQRNDKACMLSPVPLQEGSWNDSPGASTEFILKETTY